MPRKARILVPNCPHHVVQRGHNRQAVFLEEQDYRYYIENLQEWKETLGLKVYAWCLMTNHIHLIVEPGEDGMALSAMMKRVNGRQAAYVNDCQRGRNEYFLTNPFGMHSLGRTGLSPLQREFAGEERNIRSESVRLVPEDKSYSSDCRTD